MKTLLLMIAVIVSSTAFAEQPQNLEDLFSQASQFLADAKASQSNKINGFQVVSESKIYIDSKTVHQIMESEREKLGSCYTGAAMVGMGTDKLLISNYEIQGVSVIKISATRDSVLAIYFDANSGKVVQTESCRLL